MQFILISNGFYYSHFGCGYSMETFEGARVIVLSPNPVHEGHFVTHGAYSRGEGQPLSYSHILNLVTCIKGFWVWEIH